ncbi:DUF3857 domain-containing protein [Granulicella rosea]|nr:DUF3857 and transglutaminase domain-containing protein [Granulicella rosea]
MTSLPQAPGAPAVYLFYEQMSDGDNFMTSVYVRLKVLTEKGKDYGNVELPYYWADSYMSVDSISGRTIHADGTIVPLKEKAYAKMVEKNVDGKVMEKIFSMPSVEVGSILEYRFKVHFGYTPAWRIQSQLYILKAHYNWRPHSGSTNAIEWVSRLPNGAELNHGEVPGAGLTASRKFFDLTVADIPPAPNEEYMPPLDSFTYRVLFYYHSATSKEEFWRTQGRVWSKDLDQYIGPHDGVKAATRQLVSPSDTEEAKLRKIYASVMGMENTDFTREHTTAEDRAAGLKKIKTTDDVLARKSGDRNELARLFVAMARAAGLKAYVMRVVNRDHNLFSASYVDFRQLDDDIAIVDIDGKERYFDPGQRLCDFGHLAWKHTRAGGIRQTEKDTQLAQTPGESYKSSNVKRIGDLQMDEHGEVTGKLDLSFTGDPALHWRQVALRGDDTSLNKALRESLEAMIPQGLEVRVTGVDGIAEYDNPLAVHYEVSGMAGSSTGRRLLMPADLFRAQARPTFSAKQRTLPVYFHYTSITQDAIRITFPSTMKIESLPAKEDILYKKIATYNVSADQTPTTYTVRRNMALGDILFQPADYPELLSFYNKLETKDQEPVVLVHADAGAGAKPGR